MVFEGKSGGPEFRTRLPKGRYTVTTKWDDWTFSREVVVDASGRGEVLFAWARPDASASSTG